MHAHAATTTAAAAAAASSNEVREREREERKTVIKQAATHIVLLRVLPLRLDLGEAAARKALWTSRPKESATRVEPAGAS
jgi:hypothetical protein